MGFPRFDLDKNKGILILCNNVDFAQFITVILLQNFCIRSF
jgi:hypothetical protein